MQPQLADLTGDGRLDLYSGCFEGGLYVLAGRAEGGFAAPLALKDKGGRILRLGQYWDDEKSEWTGVADSTFKDELGIGGAAVDWDEDGDLDLLLGSNGGRLFLRRNEGTAAQPAFALDSESLMSGDGPLAVPGAHLIPTVVDWDGDGKFDVLSGGGDGGAFWFRNVGKKGAPRFEQAKALLEPKAERGTPQAPIWPGERTQICAADYDGDGDLDLLIGDFHSMPYVEGQKWEMHGYVWLARRE